MILLKSDKKMNNQRKEGIIVEYIFCEGEYLGQTKTHLKFRETYYFNLSEQQDTALVDENGNPIIKTVINKVILPESNSVNTMKLKTTDYGPNPTPEQIAENQNTVEFLFQLFGVDINKQTGYADGIEVNFEHIFKMVQSQKKYYNVDKWNVISQM